MSSPSPPPRVYPATRPPRDRDPLGSGVVLVALPGLGGVADSFPPSLFKETRALGVPVVAVCYPSDSVGTIAAMASAVWQTLFAMGVCGNVVLLGYSMGGFVAQNMVEQQPSRVAGVVLVATACSDGADLVIGRRVMASALRTGFAGAATTGAAGPRLTQQRIPLDLLFPAEYLERHDSAFIRDHVLPEKGDPVMPDAVWLQQLFAVLQFVVRTHSCARLADITVPVLIIHGAHDAVLPIDNARQLVGSLRRAPITTRIVRDAGHGVLYQQPGAVGSDVAAWLHGRVLPLTRTGTQASGPPRCPVGVGPAHP